MKHLALTLFSIFISFCSFAQPKAYLTLVETSKIFPITTGGFATYSAENADTDFSDISNRLDEFMRNEFLNDFGFDLVPKEEVVGNEDYKSFNSEYFATYKTMDFKGNVIRDGSFAQGSSVADGYIPNQPFSPVKIGVSDFEEMKEIFPEADLLITVNIGFSVMGSSSGSMTTSTELKSQRVIPSAEIRIISKDRKVKVIKNTTWYDVEPEDQPTFYSSEPNLEKQKEMLNAMIDKLIERMKSTKEKKIKQYSKWASKL